MYFFIVSSSKCSCCARDTSEGVGCDNISFTLVVFNKNVKRGTALPPKKDIEMQDEDTKEEIDEVKETVKEDIKEGVKEETK